MSRGTDSPILPGATLGILGGGQLGAMFAAAAKRLGYRVEADCPAAWVCDRVHVGDYADPAFLARAAAGLDAVTFEFENVPAAAGRALAAAVPVRPRPDVLFTTQDRDREKAFLTAHGFACAPHRVVRSRDELHAAVRDLGLPAVLKTAAFGYDGKGQAKLAVETDVDRAWATLGDSPTGPRELVLEGWIDFDCEISVVAARGLCRWARRGRWHRPRWRTCSATAGSPPGAIHRASPTGPRPSPCQGCGSTFTASRSPGPAARWATSRRSPPRWMRPSPLSRRLVAPRGATLRSRR